MGYISSRDAADSAIVRGLAEQALGRSVGTIVPLGGLVAHNFEVENSHIFKIASSRTSLEDWQKMVVNSSILQQHLSIEIPKPVLHTLQYGKEQIPALSYERLAGSVISRHALAESSETFKRDYISQLNDIMHELHQVPPDVLPIRPLNVLQQATNMLFNNPKARRYGSKFAEYLFPYSSDHPVLLHTDLHSENVCFNGKKITGLLDFDSLSVGHPVFEFRPKLYEKSEDLNWALDDYMKRYPSEVSKPIVRDFLRKFHTVYCLFFMMSLVRGNKKNKTRFEDILKTYRSGRFKR